MTIDQFAQLVITQVPSMVGLLLAIWIQKTHIDSLDRRITDLEKQNQTLIANLIGKKIDGETSEEKHTASAKAK